MKWYQLENLNNKSDKIHSCIQLQALDKVFEGVYSHKNAHRQSKKKQKNRFYCINCRK